MKLFFTSGTFRTILSTVSFVLAIALSASALPRFAVASGPWNSTATWSSTSGGAPGASVPGAADAVTINNGFIVTLDINANVNSLTISSGELIQGGFSVTTPTFAISGGTFTGGAGALTVTNLTLGSGTLTAPSGLFAVSGSWTMNGGTFTPGSNAVTFNGTGAQAINGSVATQTFNDLVINKSANTLSVGGSTTTLNVANLTRTAGTFTAPATVNVTGTILLTAGTYTAGANTNVGGDFTNNGGTFTPGSNTITFNGAANQAINGSVASQALNNFVVNKAGGILSVAASVTTLSVANVTLTSGTFEAGANTSVSGNFTNNGATFTPGPNTVTFTGGATQSINGTAIAQTFNNLVINKSGNALSAGGSTVTLNVNNLTRTAGTFTAPATLNVTGTILLTAGTYTAGANTNVAGDITNNGGTFTAGAGTFTFNGTGAQVINGSTATQTFNNFIVDKTSGTLSVAASVTTLNTATITLTSGTFAGGPNTVLSGNFTNNGATFTPGTGIVTFNSGTAQAINGTVSTQTFNNIVVAKTGGTTLTVGGSTTTLNVAAFTLTSGNFAAPSTFYATGALTLTAGTFTANTNTNLDGDFNGNGGTFTAGSNTVTFGGAGSKTIAGSVTTIASFYDLVVTSGSVLFGNASATRTLNIQNNFTISGGSFSSGATVAGAYTINLQGNLQNDGTLDLSNNSATNHRLIFSGSAAKSISGSGSNTVYHLRMSTTGASNVNVNSNLRINGTLDWTSDGLLLLNGTDITFGTAALLGTGGAAPSATRYIQGDGTSSVTGQVVKVNAGSSASWQFLFPIGTSIGGYTPVDLTAATITNAPTVNSRLAAKAILSVDAPGRLKRTFRLTVAGNGISTTFTNGRFNYLNPGDVSGSELISTYTTFWYQKESTGIWTRPGTAPTGPGTVNTSPTLSFFTGPTVAQSLTNDTYYFTIGTPGAYGQTWYSYQTGNWDNPLSWTTDGSSFPLYSNTTPGSIPGPADNVVITSGKTITVNVNNITINSINVIGTLDLQASTGNTFTNISGLGRIKMAGSTDNFPAGTATNFADNSIGGTLEINGSGILLNTTRAFNNVVINMSANANAAVLKSNYTLNGDLTVTKGVLQFEDLTAPVNRTLTVSGNVVVDASGGIAVAASNNRHRFNFNGDFTNNGTAKFTNRTVANFSAEAIDGIVDATFNSALQDQLISCNGVTNFYRIEINKGIDDTYIASFTSAAPGNFNLFGFANQDIDDGTGTTNSNAVGLIRGTVKLGTNITVTLNTTGNYAIRLGARLWIDGAIVDKTVNAVVPYGTVRISAGSLTVNTDGGLTLRDSGIILIEGGTLTLGTIRTSVNGSNAVGSYIQSGGSVILSGPAHANYSQFSLTYPSNVFNMSGGTLTIRTPSGSGTRGALFINSDPANISVTGGTVVFEVTNGNPYKITSKAPFWNVIMRKTGGATSVIQLLGTTSGQGSAPDLQTLAIQPLNVLNDFTIEGTTAVTFLTNNADVSVGGDFEIKSGGTYTHGTNTTTISGPGVSSLIFGNAATQTVNNFTINKTNTTDEVAITTGNATALRVQGAFTLSKGVFNYGSLITSAQGAVTLASGTTVGKSASTGRLTLDGSSNQTLSSSSAIVHNIEINNAAGVTLVTGGLSVLRNLTLTLGVFNIGTFKLRLEGSSAAISGGPLFGTTKMIQTAANSSDGGLELYLDGNKTLTFPLGVSGKYTPVTAVFTSYSGDGYVRISPANGVLQTTNLSGGADILAYYWRVSSSNFTTKPTVRYTFRYARADVGGTEANYFPGKVLDVTPFTRSNETPSTKIAIVDATSSDITFNGTGSGFTLEDANYTAGGVTRFDNTTPVRVFYTRKLADAAGQSWTDNNATTGLWTRGTNTLYGAHDSRQTPAGASPGAGDIAVIGWVPFGDPIGNNGNPHGVELHTTQQVAEVRFAQMLDIGNLPTARVYFRNFQFRPTLCLNNNGGGNQGQLASGTKVSGEGMFWNRSTGGDLSDPTFAGVDLGGFNSQDSSFMVYESTLNDAFYAGMPATLPNLTLATDNWGQNDKNSTITTNVTTNGNLELLGNVNLVLGTTAGNIIVNKNLKLVSYNGGPGPSSGGGGEVRFGNVSGAKSVTVLGNLVLGNGSSANIRVLSPSTNQIEHTFNLYGDFIQRTTNGNGFKGGTTANQDRINFNLLGSTSMTLTNSGGDTPQFYTLSVNKGNSIATTAQFNANFTIDGPSNAATKSFVIQNGLFIINHASPVITLTSGGGDFNIPSTAGLEVRLGTVRTSTTNTLANITLDGLLRISGGTATIDSGVGFANYIEYSNSGNAAIELTAGTLTVGGQLRRSLSSATGVLKYTQSAGVAVFGNRGSISNTRGVFEVLNAGSQFNHTGGSFTIVQGNGSASVPSLFLEPASSTITSGSTITIGNASTPASTIGIQSTAILNNLTLAATNAVTTSMYIMPLTVNGNLSVSTNNTLNAQSLALTIGGNFAVNGTYTPGTNTTTFTNTGSALISGAPTALSFYNFTKTGAGILTLARDINITRDLKVSAGTLTTATFTANLTRNAEIDATLTSTSGSGLIFSGSAQQRLTRSVAGTGTLGIITVNNPNGVVVPDGNGYNFNITNNLRLQAGVFDIGGGLLTLTTPAIITPVNPYSATNLIQTNSSFTDKGVRKQFPANYTTDFIFPVGQATYTPVTFVFSGGNSSGSGSPTITVRPSNKIHPSIVDDNEAGELPSPAAFNDLNNVLQYYWIISATGISSSTFKSTMNLQYVQPLVAVTSPYSEDDYIAAQILSDPSAFPNNIRKFSIAEVNEVTNVITFNFANVDELNINGEYLAGVALAIPSKVPTYTTTTSGNVGDNIYDQPVPGGIPSGSRVIVSSGDQITFNTGSVILYQTVLNAGAKIVIPSGSIGHSLGTITGTGDLEIDSDDVSAVLPAAVYDTFFSCSGGGLIFGGTGTYEILGGITNLRNLTLNGSGVKSLANNNLNICNDFTINGGGFSNSSNRTITVQNDVLLNSGTVSNSAGTLSVVRDFTQTAGSFDGGTGGQKTIGRNLTVNGGSFTPGSGTTNITRINGDMTVAGAATITTGTGGASGQKFLFAGTAAQLLTGDFTASRAFNRLEINNAAGLTIAGNTTVASQLLLTTGLITPGASTFLIDLSATIFPTQGKSTSFVNGKLYKTLAFGQGFTFPIGKGTRWRTGDALNTSGAGVTWDMEYFSATAIGAVAAAPAPRSNPVNNLVSSDAAILRIASEEYWKISDGSASSNGRTARVGLSWGIESDVSANSSQRESLKVMSWNGTNWTNNGGITFSSGHTQSRGTFESSITLSFSENIVTLGSTETANNLPIELAWFKGEIVGNRSYLYWKTESELNNDHFEIQRSVDGHEFEILGTVQGNGTTKNASNYVYEDPTLKTGKNYYRLKQFDFDGKSSYSQTIILDFDGISQLGMFVFPNPTRFDNINFKVEGTTDREVVVRLFDMNGRIVYKALLKAEDVSREMLIDAGTLKTGMYVLEVIQGKSRITQRVVIKE